MRLRFAVALHALALCVGGCEELGNPVPGSNVSSSSGLVRETDSAVGALVTETRFVSPESARDLIASLGDEVDFVDARVPPGHALVVVMVRLRPRHAPPPMLHLATAFRYPDGSSERRIWVARTNRPRFVAFFAVRALPTDARTDPL